MSTTKHDTDGFTQRQDVESLITEYHVENENTAFGKAKPTGIISPPNVFYNLMLTLDWNFYLGIHQWIIICGLLIPYYKLRIYHQSSIRRSGEHMITYPCHVRSYKP